MTVDLDINNSASPSARFLSWAPSPCRVRITNPAGATTSSVSIKISAAFNAGGGTVVFRKTTTGAFARTITLSVPVSGTSITFYAAGKFGQPSTSNGDVTIEARAAGAVVGAVPVMVRVRKNANTLTPAERDRFVSAFAQLNNQGAGRFADFRDMHTNLSAPQAHGEPAFLPWHRAYLLDLERELQAIDASVALPYWRFDQPAPNIFTPDFFGVSDANGTVQFSASNPLQFWRTDGVQGITRRPFFNVAVAPSGVLNEAQSLALGTVYRDFWAPLEIDPHGSAHVSFGGSISSVPTAARDPLFFLLHCNVDRLWAKWQRKLERFNATQAASYDSNPGNSIGHNLPDTMWPWNGVTGNPRPPTAPGGAMAASGTVSAPGPQPRVQDALDYQGSINAVARMGFDYDDVRFK